jgi:hypothetical protein
MKDIHMAAQRDIKILIQIIAPNNLVSEILETFPLQPFGKINNVASSGQHYMAISIYIDHFAPSREQLIYLAEVQEKIAASRHVPYKMSKSVNINIISAPRIATELLSCANAS